MTFCVSISSNILLIFLTSSTIIIEVSIVFKMVSFPISVKNWHHWTDCTVWEYFCHLKDSIKSTIDKVYHSIFAYWIFESISILKVFMKNSNSLMPLKKLIRKSEGIFLLQELNNSAPNGRSDRLTHLIARTGLWHALQISNYKEKKFFNILNFSRSLRRYIFIKWVFYRIWNLLWLKSWILFNFSISKTVEENSYFHDGNLKRYQNW